MNNSFRDDSGYFNTYMQGNPYVRQMMAVPTMAAPSVQNNNIFIYPQNLPNALMLIQQAITGENEDRLFYSWLIEKSPSYEDSQIIMGIRDDEIGHYGLFRQLYHELTGNMIPQAQGEEFTPPNTYCEGLSRALMGEQNAVQKYRKILYAMQNRTHINMLTEIITDEIRHGILYSYLYSKNGCKS
ncbi:ferritin-like domain-containing protein [Hydrogenoanaerobacterium sp.]|uniref:ferritin-like domain-containing protein n=1 Tax=Hydrogenoanaerobacterium sp. TaxID=2953763 RepID=UPI002899C171|nr:ferritin-like domain-containing protein [Hydrogenoanaerobacterium sp.]